MAKEKNGAFLIKVDRAKPKSAQLDEWKNIDGVVHPEISFDTLVKAYEGSFVLSGIVDKIATSADSGFVPTEDARLDALLSSFDAQEVFASLYVCGNAFLERVRNGKGETAEFKSFLAREVRIKRVDEGLKFVQSVAGKRQDFEAADVVHVRTVSLSSRYYGASRFSGCVPQVSLLAGIDQYYQYMLARGMFGSSVLNDVDKKLSREDKEALKTIIEDRLRGSENSFTTLIVPGKLERLDLDREVDTEAFVSYRTELIKSVAVSLNIPYDLLISDNSNRATAEIALETMNASIVKPLQARFVRALRDSLRGEFGAAVDRIEMVPVDTSNQLEEMRVDVGYKRAGIKTANEVRAKLGLEPAAGGDELSVSAEGATAEDPTAQATEQSIAKMYDAVFHKA